MVDTKLPICVLVGELVGEVVSAGVRNKGVDGFPSVRATFKIKTGQSTIAAQDGDG